MSTTFLFDGWGGLARILVIAIAIYPLLVAMLRVSGKRTLSKLNAFDLVVTVALGSTLASVIVDRSVPLAEGVLALLVLIALQYVITWLSTRSRRFRNLIKSEPSLLVRDGVYLETAMDTQRVTREEVEAALRGHGMVDARDAAFVVLETDGTISVIGKRE